MFTTSKHVFFRQFSLIAILNLVYAGNKVGENCSFKDGSKGTCKTLADCQSALDALAEGVFPENACEFEGTEGIFCCKIEGSESSELTSSPSPTLSTLQTTTTSTTTVVTTVTTSATHSTPTTTTTRTTTVSKEPQGERKPGDISKTKCKEYALYAYDNSESSVLTLQPQYSHSFECAFEKLPLIVRGTLATRQEFPHMALIGFEIENKILWDCGGALISEHFILTAAHCSYHRQAGPAKHVQLGITNKTDTRHLQSYIVGEIIPYPQYTNKTKYHDIALLKLTEVVELNTFVRPACLNTERELKQRGVIASGWGNIGFIDQGSNDLLKVVLKIFPIDKCNKTYRRDIASSIGNLKLGIIDDWMLCAGSSEDIKNTCQGDSGGPLQVYHEETPDIMCMYDILGVTSFGKSCGLAKDVPGVYTRVSNYIEWIESIVWPE